MSPIKKLTDRGESFPQIGKIRKGSPKTDQGMGRDLDYFRVEFDERETEVIQKFHDIYGDKPQAINIFLPFDEIEHEWDAFYEAYTAGRMIAKSDGEKFLFKINQQTGLNEVVEGKPDIPFDENVPVWSYFSPKYKKDMPIFAKPIGRLRVMVRELRRLDYLTLQTTSLYDIISITEQLKAISYVCNGHIVGVPLILKRVPKMISCPNADGTRARREKWLIAIEADPEWVEAKINNMKQLSFPEGNLVRLLPSAQNISEIPGLVERKIEQVGIPDTDTDWDPDDSDKDFTEGDFTNNPASTSAPEQGTDAKAQPSLIPENGDITGHTPCKYSVAKVTDVSGRLKIAYPEVNDILLRCKLNDQVTADNLVSWVEAYQNGVKKGLTPELAAKVINPK